MYGAKRVQDVQLSSIRAVMDKAQSLEEQGKNVIHLEIGEPDFFTPAHIVQAAQAALVQGQTHYGPNRGLLPLRQAISKKLLLENAIDADPEQEIVVTVGAAEGLFMAFAGLLNPGDEVIILEPAYISYVQLAKITQAVAVIVKASEENNWQVDPKDIEKAITSQTRMIIVNSPNNPTGAVYSYELLQSVAALAQKYNLLVVSDEVYEKIMYSGCKHFSIASFPGMKERTITINGYSKTYAMTGWRLAYVAASRELIMPMLKIHQYAATCTTTFAQVGATVATSGSQQCVVEMVAEFERRRDLVYRKLSDIEELSCLQPQGAFYAFINIKKSGLAAVDFVDAVLNEAGVSLVPGVAFGASGEGYVRLSYANTYENVESALERLKAAAPILRKRSS